jgi:hypothetical protein
MRRWTWTWHWTLELEELRATITPTRYRNKGGAYTVRCKLQYVTCHVIRDFSHKQVSAEGSQSSGLSRCVSAVTSDNMNRIANESVGRQ